MNLPPSVAPLWRSHAAVLTEAAVLERLRRESGLDLDPWVANAGMIYHERGREALGGLYRAYAAIAERHRLPILLTAPTWRAQRDRVAQSAWCDREINGDAVRFMQAIAATVCAKHQVGGLIGPKGDCYRPAEAPSAEDAHRYHDWQVERLVAAGASFLLAATLPALPEALGIARASSTSGIPYLVSFVLSPEGCMLDGTLVEDAIKTIDSSVAVQPDGYLFNCTHWSFARRALLAMPMALIRRVLGIQANTAACHPLDLDGTDRLIAEEPAEFAAGMAGLNFDFGLRVLGGCCGSNQTHLEALASRLTAP